VLTVGRGERVFAFACDSEEEEEFRCAGTRGVSGGAGDGGAREAEEVDRDMVTGARGLRAGVRGSGSRVAFVVVVMTSGGVQLWRGRKSIGVVGRGEGVE
jgi:hypothetical protein